MVKSYQEIVRTSSKRVPNSRTKHNGNGGGGGGASSAEGGRRETVGAGAGGEPSLSASSTGANGMSDARNGGMLAPPAGNGTLGGGGASDEANTLASSVGAASTAEKKKSRFHALAKLQMGSLGRRDRDKKKDELAASVAVSSSSAGASGGADANGVVGSSQSSPSRRYPPPSPGGSAYPPYGYPYPAPCPYGPSLHPHSQHGYAASYGALPSPHHAHARGGRYPAASSATASTSILPSPSGNAPSGIPSTSASAHSPTSPTTPASTGVAHYYPYVASQPRRQDSGTGTMMASPQSFKSRGAQLQNGLQNGINGEGGTSAGGDEEESEVLGKGKGVAASEAGSSAVGGRRGGSGSARREPTLPPGAGAPSVNGGGSSRIPSNGTSHYRQQHQHLSPPHPRPQRAHSNPPPPRSSVAPGPHAAPPYPAYPYLPPPVPLPPHHHPHSSQPHLPRPPHHPAAAAASAASLRSQPAPSVSTARPPLPAPHHPAVMNPYYPYPPPPPGYPAPYPPGAAAYPGYPPYPPYGYPPYGYAPPPPPPPPPPPSTSAPPPPPPAAVGPSGVSTLPPSHPSYAHSLASSAAARGPPPPPASASLLYGPHPLSGPASFSSSSPAVHAVAAKIEAERARTAAGGAGTGTGTGTGTGAGAGAGAKKRDGEQEGKLSVGIDFGTTFTGIAYGSSRLFAGQVRQILSWPGSYETYRKVPTCILYEQHDPAHEAKVVAWGIEAKNATVTRGLIKCEWFKLLLSPESLRSGIPDPWIPPLPVGKNVVDVIADFLKCVWRYARRMITEEIGSVADLNAADVILTVPAAWDASAAELMRRAAIQAGTVQSSRGGDLLWRDRLRIITEPEAAAIHASTLSPLLHLRPSQTFIICDAGGGTVDTAAYKLMGELGQLDIAEMCTRTGSNCGSLFLDWRFEELIKKLLQDHPVHLAPESIATFIHAFSEGDKLAYRGTADDDDAIFRFNCFNVEDSHDPAVGLEFGELAISGKVLKTEVFDPVIEQVLDHILTQLGKIAYTPVDAIILVGGFAASEYLYTRVRQTFGARIPVIVRPQDCDTATLRGAARYGLGFKSGKGAVSSVIAPRSYCIKSKLPAEEEDHWRRPEFVATNDGGTVVCENRLSYLIAKGAVLRKGERLRSRFCKYIKDPHDSVFTAHLYVSDSEELYRYTDEGDLRELCRWTLDLATLPRFESVVNSGGGYIEFEAGLSLDSAEVRGVLMTEDGVECAAATFEFLGT
ncbi:hypothetical protein JCM11251_002259 [Rhodosporidiobolus azoricus]